MEQKRPEWIIRWILGIVATVIVVGGLSWLTTVQASQIKTEGRLSTLEANYASQSEDIKEIKDDIKEILRRVR